MLDALIAKKRYDFLGKEFLAWLWWAADKGHIAGWDMSVTGVHITQSNAEHTDSITINGSPGTQSLDAARRAIAKGGKVCKIALVFEGDLGRFAGIIRAEDLAITSLHTPATAPVRISEELHGALLEKISMHNTVVRAMQRLYGEFLCERLETGFQSRPWPETVQLIHKWAAGDR